MTGSRDRRAWPRVANPPPRESAETEADHGLYRRPPYPRLPTYGAEAVVVLCADLRSLALAWAAERALPGLRVHVAHHYDDAVKLARRCAVAVAVVALTATGRAWWDRIGMLRQDFGPTPLLVVSDWIAGRVLRGIRAIEPTGLYSEICDSEDTLVTALEQVATGRRFLSPTLRRHMHAASGPPLESLLSRPMEDLLCHLGVSSEDEIARKLGATPHAVRKQRARICAKLDLRGPAELERFQVANGYVGVAPTGERCRGIVYWLNRARQPRA